MFWAKAESYHGCSRILKKSTFAAWSWRSRRPLFPYELGEKIFELFKELMHKNHKRYVTIQIYQQISTMTNVVFWSELSRWSFFWVQLRPFTPMHLGTRYKEFSANCTSGAKSPFQLSPGAESNGGAFNETPRMDLIHRQAGTPSSPWVAWKSTRSCPACPINSK